MSFNDGRFNPDANNDGVLTLQTPVKVRAKEGVVIGRTFEREPRYDVMLANKRVLCNVPAREVRRAG